MRSGLRGSRCWSSVAEAARSVNYNDQKIVEKLNLDETGNGYAIDGDPFCEIDGRLLNNADEIEQVAEQKRQVGIVIDSRAGNVGVIGLVPFAARLSRHGDRRSSTGSIPSRPTDPRLGRRRGPP